LDTTFVFASAFVNRLREEGERMGGEKIPKEKRGGNQKGSTSGGVSRPIRLKSPLSERCSGEAGIKKGDPGGKEKKKREGEVHETTARLIDSLFMPTPEAKKKKKKIPQKKRRGEHARILSQKLHPPCMVGAAEDGRKKKKKNSHAQKEEGGAGGTIIYDNCAAVSQLLKHQKLGEKKKTKEDFARTPFDRADGEAGGEKKKKKKKPLREKKKGGGVRSRSLNFSFLLQHPMEKEKAGKKKEKNCRIEKRKEKEGPRKGGPTRTQVDREVSSFGRVERERYGGKKGERKNMLGRGGGGEEGKVTESVLEVEPTFHACLNIVGSREGRGKNKGMPLRKKGMRLYLPLAYAPTHERRGGGGGRKNLCERKKEREKRGGAEDSTHSAHSQFQLQ